MWTLMANVLVFVQPLELQTSLEEDLQQIEHVVASTKAPHTELPAQLLCNVYFRIEAEAALIEEVLLFPLLSTYSCVDCKSSPLGLLYCGTQVAGSGWLSAREIKQAIDAELRERAGVFFARFFRFRQIVLSLGVKYLIKYLENPDFNLHTEVLYALLEPKPDSVESLLTKLSSRVTTACPTGVLATAQRVSGAAAAAASAHNAASPPAPPAAPMKAAPVPTPALRPTTAVTTSPLLLAAYNAPLLNPSSQVYCSLPPALEGQLLASPTTPYAPSSSYDLAAFVLCGRGSSSSSSSYADCQQQQQQGVALGRVVQLCPVECAAAAR
jgi:hypothetical protein